MNTISRDITILQVNRTFKKASRPYKGNFCKLEVYRKSIVTLTLS